MANAAGPLQIESPNRLATALGQFAGGCLRRVASHWPPPTTDSVLAVARRRMRRTFCTVITDGADGPTARVVQAVGPDADLTVYLGTGRDTRKARQIAATGRAVLVFEDDRAGACLTAYCDATISSDLALRRRVFRPTWRAYWPDGPASGDFVVIACRPYALELWDLRGRIAPAPFGLASARLTRGADGRFVLGGGPA